MAGGFKNFGPTYNSTPYLRLGYEGFLNGNHGFDPSLLGGNSQADEPKLGLAGKFVTITENGVALANGDDKMAVGLFREDLQDMVNASHKATFYFRGGEYYVNKSRTADVDFAVGEKLYVDSEGRLTNVESPNKQVVGIVTHVGEYRAGNMYEHATQGVVDADTFIGFIMLI